MKADNTTQSRFLKLHLGCWKRFIPGFVHIDLVDLPHIDYKSNIDNLSMFEDQSVGLIYSSHNLEYFDRVDVSRVLREWHRVLVKNGVLRIAVPDIDKLLRVYKKTKDLKIILGPLYGRMEIDTLHGKETIYHKTIYNFKDLKTLLESHGFYRVKRYNWKNTIHKDYDDHSQAYFPHMDKTNGLLISLNVEGKKV